MRLSSISLLCVAIALFCCTPSKESASPPTEATQNVSPAPVSVKPSPAVSVVDAPADTLVAEVPGYGPEIFGVRLGMQINDVPTRLEKGGGGGYFKEILEGGKGTNVRGGDGLGFKLPLSNGLDTFNLWSLQRRVFFFRWGAAGSPERKVKCRPETVAVFHESGLVTGVAFDQPDYPGDYEGCYNYFGELLGGVNEFEFHGSTISETEYGDSAEYSTRYFHEGDFSMRCILMWSESEGGGGDCIFMLEGRPATELPPELRVRATEKPVFKFIHGFTYPANKVFTHINFPVLFIVDGLDFSSGKDPKFKWFRDCQNEPDDDKQVTWGSSASFVWEKQGVYTVAVKGTGINGKSTVKTVEVEVSPHHYKTENISPAQFVLKKLPNDIIPLVWGEDVNDVTGSIVNSVKNVTEARLFDLSGKFRAYRIRVRIPSIIKEAAAYTEIVTELEKSLGKPKEIVFGPLPLSPTVRIWETQETWVMVEGSEAFSLFATIEVFNKAMWNRDGFTSQYPGDFELFHNLTALLPDEF